MPDNFTSNPLDAILLIYPDLLRCVDSDENMPFMARFLCSAGAMASLTHQNMKNVTWGCIFHVLECTSLTTRPTATTDLQPAPHACQ